MMSAVIQREAAAPANGTLQLDPVPLHAGPLNRAAFTTHAAIHEARPDAQIGWPRSANRAFDALRQGLVADEPELLL